MNASSAGSRFLVWLYSTGRAPVQNLAIRMAAKREGGEIHSASMREMFSRYEGVEIGLYSHGGCFVRGAFDGPTTIGRYCSIARTAKRRDTLSDAVPANLTVGRGIVRTRRAGERGPQDLKVGNDVWIGHNAVISKDVAVIGDGAVVAAGSVVVKDVPPYAIVVGNPARVVRYRFDKQTVDFLLGSKWWERPSSDLKAETMMSPRAFGMQPESPQK